MSTNDKEMAERIGRLARDCGGFERHTETDDVTRVDYVFTQECLLKFVRAVQCHEPASAALQELRLSIKKWWSKHQYDTTGDHGEWNVYDEEPEFVQLARKAMQPVAQQPHEAPNKTREHFEAWALTDDGNCSRLDLRKGIDGEYMDPLVARDFLVWQAAQETQPVAWLIDWPDEPELGHYFAEEPSELRRSMPLYTAAPAKPTEQINPWHEAIINACMNVESCYVYSDPVQTLRNLIDWYVNAERSSQSDCAESERQRDLTLKGEQQAPTAKQSLTVEQVLNFAANTIELFDDKTMESNYMLDAGECADIIRALASFPFEQAPAGEVPNDFAAYVALQEIIDMPISVDNEEAAQLKLIAVRALSTPPAVPQGWKLVPEKVTREMQDAWDTSPFNEDIDAEFSEAYRRMLSAAPAPSPAVPPGWKLALPGGKRTDEWESARVADYNKGWNDYRKAANAALDALSVAPAAPQGEQLK